MDDVKKRSAWPLIVSLAVFVPVLYLLSSGPVIAIANRYWESNRDVFEVLGVVYWPVGWLAEQSKGFEELLFAYLIWWCRILGVA
jgi:hypothetical protein